MPIATKIKNVEYNNMTFENMCKSYLTFSQICFCFSKLIDRVIVLELPFNNFLVCWEWKLWQRQRNKGLIQYRLAIYIYMCRNRGVKSK